MISELPNLTFEQIDQLQTKLPWMKKALKLMKGSLVRDDLTIDIESHIVDGFLPDQTGVVQCWNGAETFITIDRGCAILVSRGKLLWFPKAGGMWFETIFSQNIDQRLFAQTSFVTQCTKADYMKMYRDKINGIVGGTVIDMTKRSEEASRLGNLGVRFR